MPRCNTYKCIVQLNQKKRGTGGRGAETPHLQMYSTIIKRWWLVVTAWGRMGGGTGCGLGSAEMSQPSQLQCLYIQERCRCCTI